MSDVAPASGETPTLSQSYASPVSGAEARPAEQIESKPPRKLKIPQAAWNSMIVFSFAVNLVLVIVVLVLGILLFSIKNAIAQPLIGGLHSSFVQMDNAHIVTNITVNDTIQVNDTIPVVFDLPLNQATVVTLTAPATIYGATIVSLSAGGLQLYNAVGDIVLPAGTSLPVQLSLVVPVSQTVPVVLNVPVNLNVPVDIALDQTDLHPPFTNLANLIGPYNSLLEKAPNSWAEVFGGK
jgi:hypothetical protein